MYLCVEAKDKFPLVDNKVTELNYERRKQEVENWQGLEPPAGCVFSL